MAFLRSRFSTPARPGSPRDIFSLAFPILEEKETVEGLLLMSQKWEGQGNGEVEGVGGGSLSSETLTFFVIKRMAPGRAADKGGGEQLVKLILDLL